MSFRDPIPMVALRPWVVRLVLLVPRSLSRVETGIPQHLISTFHFLTSIASKVCLSFANV